MIKMPHLLTRSRGNDVCDIIGPDARAIRNQSELLIHLFKHNVKRMHPYQRGRASITGFGL
jgi:hypothetical protein